VAEKLPTPTCEVSGLPLPVLPLEPRLFGALSFDGKPNSHHHFHPEKSPSLQTLAGIALRKSRIQTTPLKAHNEYHRLYEGPILTDDQDEIFRLCVLSVAGVVPRRAIDPRKPDRTVGLSDKAHNSIVGSIKIDQPKEVARFFANYCAAQETDKQLVDILLDPEITKEKRLLTAREILGVSLESALGSLILEHKDMKKERLVRSNKPLTPYAAARRLVRRHALEDFVHHLTGRFANA
jgi:hypothetical protein